MKIASSFGLGTSLIAATVTAATVVAVAPAQASMLWGSVSLEGDAVIPNLGDPTILMFEDANMPISGTGNFMNLMSPFGSPMFKPLNLTNIMGDMYQTGYIESFIDFGIQTLVNKDGVEKTERLTFNLFDTKVTHTQFGSNLQFFTTFEGAEGQFVFGDETMATGFLSSSRAGGPGDSSYQMTLTTNEVPEPLTTLATGLALGFGGLLQRQRSGKAKK